MLKKILLVLVLAVAAFAVYVATRPNEFRVERSKTIAAPPSAVFEQVNDFHNWQTWSPWAKLDPDAKVTFEGPAAGKDSVFRWSGNKQVGAGRMKILESKPHELVRIELEFTEPQQNAALVEMALKPEGNKTAVTWSMSGKHDSFIGKAFCTIMNMDKMVGNDYEQGLNNLQQLVEAKPKAESPVPAAGAPQSPATPTATPAAATSAGDPPDPVGAFQK